MQKIKSAVRDVGTDSITYSTYKYKKLYYYQNRGRYALADILIYCCIHINFCTFAVASCYKQSQATIWFHIDRWYLDLIVLFIHYILDLLYHITAFDRFIYGRSIWYTLLWGVFWFLYNSSASMRLHQHDDKKNEHDETHQEDDFTLGCSLLVMFGFNQLLV